MEYDLPITTPSGETIARSYLLMLIRNQALTALRELGYSDIQQAINATEERGHEQR